MKRKIFISMIAYSGLVYANTYNVILDKGTNYVVANWVDIEAETSNWVYSDEYDCTGWSPSVVDYNDGIDFEQNQTCQQVQEKEKNTANDEIRDSGEPYDEVVTITNSYTQDATGSYKGTSCLDILNKGEHHSTGMYELQNGSTVYCEMTVWGGGYQLKRTR